MARRDDETYRDQAGRRRRRHLASPEERDARDAEARRLRAKGLSFREIAQQLRWGRGTVERAVRNAPPPTQIIRGERVDGRPVVTIDGQPVPWHDAPDVSQWSPTGIEWGHFGTLTGHPPPVSLAHPGATTDTDRPHRRRVRQTSLPRHSSGRSTERPLRFVVVDHTVRPSRPFRLARVPRPGMTNTDVRLGTPPSVDGPSLRLVSCFLRRWSLNRSGFNFRHFSRLVDKQGQPRPDGERDGADARCGHDQDPAGKAHRNPARLARGCQQAAMLQRASQSPRRIRCW